MSRLLLLLMILPILVYANPADEQGLIETGQWQISVAVGLGGKTNPLVGGDDIPLLIVPDIAYYGDSFYFDNGELGYTLIDNPSWSLSLLTRLNLERANFSFLHPANIFLASGGNNANSGSDIPNPNENVIDIKDLNKRKFAIDAGVQLNYFFSDTGSLNVQLLADISGVYSGVNGAIEYSKIQALGDWQLGLGAGLRFNSAKLLDHYYGISEADGVSSHFYYQPSSGVSPFIKLTGSYPLTDEWQLLSLFRWSKLSGAMKASPIVEDSGVTTVFVGVSHEF